MSMIDRHLKNKLIDVIYHYLDGQDLAITRQKLATLSQENHMDVKKLYQSLVVYPHLETQLLTTLRVPKQYQKHYKKKPNLYELLTHLHQDGYGHGHLKYLLTLIEDTQYKPYKNLQITGSLLAVVLSIATLFYFKPKYFRATLQLISKALPQLLIKIGKKIAGVPAGLTLVGMVYTSALYLYFLYRTFSYGVSNFNQKFFDLFFRTSATALSLAGYTLCFLASGAASPLTAILFISGSAVDVVESLFTYCTIRFKSLPERNSLEQTWNVLSNHARKESQQNHAGKELVVKLTAALMITALVTIWCIFPPSLLITLGCLISIGVVGFIKSSILNRLDANHTAKLQSTLQSIKQELHKNTLNESLVTANSMKPVLSTSPTAPVYKPVIQKDMSTPLKHQNRFFSPALAKKDEQERHDLNSSTVCGMN